MERVQKLIAQAGLASRRAAETMIEQGRITVNGKRITPGDKADPYKDEIRVDGKPLPKPEVLKYYLVHKPRGVLSSVQIQEQMPDLQIITDLVPDDVRLFPVGRLDLNSEGLVLMTNDGDLTQRLTHPRYGHKKTYKVELEGFFSDDKVTRWKNGGIVLEDGFRTSSCSVKVLNRTRRKTVVRVVMNEGHKRQIRETAAALGHKVSRLVRTHIGPLELGEIPSGQYRELNRKEVEQLKTSLNKEEKMQRRNSRSSKGSNKR
jgi:23S rRNA pseudouridine2605 synthase